jgi:KUP system potassium uptake protein
MSAEPMDVGTKGSAPAGAGRTAPVGHRVSLAALSLGALGVVFGDIGTSPLYTLKECLLTQAGPEAQTEGLFGILSLMFWALILVVTVKYVWFIMRADNHGEGGIFALLALVPERFRKCASPAGRATLMALLAVIGAALLYGDGVITPAISVLSAIEGLTVASSTLEPAVVPLTCAILVALFAVQRLGTGGIGKVFGPIMAVWFTTLAGLGVYHIAHRPNILAALLPHHAVHYFVTHGPRGALILGSVVLAVTGGEALYADMGHFGLRPIRLSWTFFVLPSLVLCYLGQGALVLRDSQAAENPFFAMVPAGPATLALVFLSSAATVIASQALISGAFSLTRQAMVLGYLPRMIIKHTAYHTEGQIYIPRVNYLLAFGSIALVLVFRQSVKLAAAYGIAVTGTMTITSILFYVVCRHTWGWSRLKAGSLLALFLCFDVPFLVANLFKFFEGGYVPMLIGAALIARMLIWSRGRTSLLETYESRYSTFDQAKPLIERSLTTRVPGAAVFFSHSAENVPPVLVHYAARTRSLHETVVMLTVERPPVPVVADDGRWRLTPLGDGYFRLVVAFGYMEEPRLLPVLNQAARSAGIPLDSTDTTFYVGYETIVVENESNINRLPEALFSYFNRNALHDEEHYGVPIDQVVEIGSQIRV